MEIRIEPHKKGEEGIICMPLVCNIPDAGQRHRGWKMTVCPVCGTDCWETDIHRRALKREPGLKAACTICALKAGTKSDE